jgi:hypothetical protein
MIVVGKYHGDTAMTARIANIVALLSLIAGAPTFAESETIRRCEAFDGQRLIPIRSESQEMIFDLREQLVTTGKQKAYLLEDYYANIEIANNPKRESSGNILDLLFGSDEGQVAQQKARLALERIAELGMIEAQLQQTYDYLSQQAKEADNGVSLTACLEGIDRAVQNYSEHGFKFGLWGETMISTDSLYYYHSTDGGENWHALSPKSGIDSNVESLPEVVSGSP